VIRHWMYTGFAVRKVVDAWDGVGFTTAVRESATVATILRVHMHEDMLILTFAASQMLLLTWHEGKSSRI
jgi:hypothetical protein